MSGIRLYPNYHRYSLNAPVFSELLRLATNSGVFVQLAVAMEDSRTQHVSLRAADVDLRPLFQLAPEVKGVRIQLLGARLRPVEATQLGELPGIYFDTARVEGTDGVPTLCQAVPANRVLFGSHAPLLIPEAALIRVHESQKLDHEALVAVYADNARRFTDRIVS